MICSKSSSTGACITRGVLALLVCVHCGLSQAAVTRTETRNATLSLDTNTGDLVGLSWKKPALEIIGEAKLGENFRILLPRADYEANYFYSREQKISKNVPLPDGVSLQYDSLRNEREEVDVKVIYEIRDTGSQLQFTIQVDNGTDRKLAEVVYGMVGGQQGIRQRADTESLIPGAHYNLGPHLFSQYHGGGGSNNLGVRYAIAAFQYPGNMSMGWIDVFNRKADRGYYYANQDPETRTTSLYMEMHPYTKAVAPKDNWPSSADLPPGEPLGLTMGWRKE